MRLPNFTARLLNNDHRAVRQITDRLVRVLSFLNQIEKKLFSRQIFHAQTLRQLIQIQHFRTFHRCDFVKIIVKCHDNRAVLFCKRQQPIVNTLASTAAVLQQLYCDTLHRLQFRHNVKPMARASAFIAIGMVCQKLQLTDH